MAAARSFDEKRARLRALPSVPEGEAREELKKLLADKQGYLVGESAEMAKKLELSALIPDLVAAFPRLMPGGAKIDSGCFGKNRILEALLAFDAYEADTYLMGLRYKQFEGALPFRVDTAAGLRGLCCHALFHIRHPTALLEVTPLLFDDEATTRAEAAAALGGSGMDGAAAVLHMKVLSGDSEPDVLGALYKGLLRIFPERYLGLVEGALSSKSEGQAEAAALALGESKAKGALDVLVRAARQTTMFGRVAESIFLGLSLLRSTEAIDFLRNSVAEAPLRQASVALSALALHRHDQTLTISIQKIVTERKSDKLTEIFAEKFVV